MIVTIAGRAMLLVPRSPSLPEATKSIIRASLKAASEPRDFRPRNYPNFERKPQLCYAPAIEEIDDAAIVRDSIGA